MDTQIAPPELPAPPPAPEEPQRKRLPVWLITVAAIGIVVGVASTLGGDPSTAATGGSSRDDGPACVDMGTTQDLVDSATGHLTAAQGEAVSFDLEGAADELDGASADVYDLADVWADYPTIHLDATQAAGYLADAADAAHSGDINGSAQYLGSATDSIDGMTADVEALTGTVTPC